MSLDRSPGEVDPASRMGFHGGVINLEKGDLGGDLWLRDSEQNTRLLDYM